METKEVTDDKIIKSKDEKINFIGKIIYFANRQFFLNIKR